ncbi:carbohydrate ABC transporter permease [Streptomyces sp. NPDC060035]|uniref:carbohydrate ABC transporter permease n=1 Tax=Streptomyces sp. NPDC060035 TaxID=3347044 RepID=UPI0036B78B78
MSGSVTVRTRRVHPSEQLGGSEGRRRRWTPGRVVLLVIALVLAVAWLVPLAWAVATSLKPEGETTGTPLEWIGSRITFDAYAKVWESGELMRWLMNSVYISLMTTVLTVVTCAMAAYGFTRTEFRGRRLLYGLVLAGIMVPPQVLIAPLFQEMVQLGLVDTYWGVILPQVAVPAMVFILVKFFEGVPRELEEAAFVDGAGRWRVFWTIVIPLSRPVLAAVAIFTFISTWNNFLWPFLVTTDPNGMTLPVGLVNVQSSFGVRYAQIMAALVIAGLPLLVVFALFQRQIVRGIAHTGLAGQ